MPFFPVPAYDGTVQFDLANYEQLPPFYGEVPEGSAALAHRQLARFGYVHKFGGVHGFGYVQKFGCVHGFGCVQKSTLVESRPPAPVLAPSPACLGPRRRRWGAGGGQGRNRGPSSLNIYLW